MTSSSQPRGRRPGASDTRAAIAEAARHQFGALGYRRASLRAIAGQAGVDPHLIVHYFGSKQELFVTVLDLPFEPRVVIDRLLAAGPRGLGGRLAQFVLSIWRSPDGLRTGTALIRAAASDVWAAELLRELVTERLLVPLVVRIGSDRPELRASLIASQIVGLATARHIVGLDPLRSTPDELLADSLAPVFEHYLSGDLDSGESDLRGAQAPGGAARGA